MIQEKRFVNITKKITIFVEENQKNGILKGIYIKEKLDNNESKIISAKNGRLIKSEKGFNFKLLDGKITTIDNRGSINLNFKETIYELSKLGSNIRQTNKLNETQSSILIDCLNKFAEDRKTNNIRCNKETSFSINEIYEEMFQRIVNPIYIIILSLISSVVIVKPKVEFLENYLKFILFIIGFFLILFSQLSYKFIYFSKNVEVVFILLPIIFIFIFYLILFVKTKFKLKYL